MKNTPAIQWEFLAFDQLDAARLYSIMKARAEVFVVEQNCVYLDNDDIDQKSHHLIGWGKPCDVGAYLRVVPPGEKYDEPALGRIITTKPYRGMGLGRELMRRAIAHCQEIYPAQGIRMSAQQYLEKFYGDFGFTRVSDVYDEDGIPHIEMLLSPGEKV